MILPDWEQTITEYAVRVQIGGAFYIKPRFRPRFRIAHMGDTEALDVHGGAAMPSDLTIFAAKYLVFLDAVIALVVCLWLLYGRQRIDAFRWVVACVIMIVLAYIFAKIGNGVYSDPRPFVTDHVPPLISHARDNGFPSDHALLAAAIVAAVLFLSPAWSVLFAAIAVLVDWARVGAGLHHVADVLGSSVFVAIAALIAIVVTPFIVQALVPLLPESWAPRQTEIRQV